MDMIIGLDVHSKSTVYFAQNSDGEKVGRGTVTTSVEGLNEMTERLDAPKGTRIGLETGTQATLVARILFSLGMEPVVIDAREVRQKARRKNQKSDRRDAFEICDSLRRGIYVCQVYIPGTKVQKLRRILSRRRHFVNECTRQVNAARHLLRSEGLSTQARSLTTWCAWQKMMADPELSDLRYFLRMHARIWRQAKENVKKLDAKLEKAMKPFEKTEAVLRSAPGVGPICSATFIAALGTPHRFTNSGQVASYCGLVPSGYDSGDSVRRGHITKAGSKELRAMLCEVAHQAARSKHPLNPYWRKAMARGGYQKAVVVVAHRMARILFQMWKKGEDFDVTRLNVICEKVVKQKTYYYRVKDQEAATAQ